MKKMIAVALLSAAAGLAYVPTLAQAQVGVSITIGSAPPPVRYEAVPTSRRGYVWVPGFWDWNGSQYFWVGGHWERLRPGYAYRNPVWRQYPDGWRLERGGWHDNPPPRKGPPRGHAYGHDKHDRHDRDHDWHDGPGRGPGPDRH